MQIRNSFIWTWNYYYTFTSTALYAAIANGGKLVTPSLIKDRKIDTPKNILSKDTSNRIEKYFKKSS